MHSLTEHVERPVRKSPGPCICRDPDYRNRFRDKWRPAGP
jgi:hypothetical protein